MAKTLEGKDVSLWVGTTKQTNYPQLTDDAVVYDAAVIGGGITGIATAYALQRAGLRVVLLEKGRLVEWTTGGTTAKLSSQHYLIYDYLIHRHGLATAQAFANANQGGIATIERLTTELDLDSDFSRRSAYIFTHDTAKVAAIKAEVAAAERLGLPASFETTTDLPFPVTAALRFRDQAQFHPRKFLLGLAEKFIAGDGVIYEQTEATDIRPGTPHTVVTKQGTLQAVSVVQASGEPFWGGDIFDGRMWIKMSYGLAATLQDPSAYPQNMYITTDEPLRTIRSAPYQDGQVLIFGGESHEYSDETYDPDTHYRALIDDVRRKFDVDTILYRWLAGDYMPYDRIPYIGAHPDHASIYIVTGYRAWGLAWAMAAADIIAGDITDKPLDWAAPFRLDRLQEPIRDEDKHHTL